MDESRRRAEIVAELTAPGGGFAIGTARVRGVELPVYTDAPASVRDVLVAAAHPPDRPAVTFEDETRTWGEHTDLVARFATLLVERYGIGKGDRVAIAMRNYPEWVVVFAAAAAVGAVCVPLNAWWTGSELVDALADCGAAVLVADRERTESVQPQRHRLPGLRAVVEVRPGRPSAVTTSGRPCSPANAAGSTSPRSRSTPTTTSRSSTRRARAGARRAVATNRAHVTVLSNLRLHAVVESRLAQCRGEPLPPPPEQPTLLVPGPLFHVAYLPRLISSAVTGVHLVLMHRWDARRAVELIEREGVDTLTAVPTVARQLMDEIERSGAQLPSLRTLGTGGAQSTSALIARIGTLLGGRVGTGTGYGLTETTGAMVMIGSRDYFRRPLSVGRPFPTSQLRVVGADGCDVPDGEVGEAWFKGASLARGYWNHDSTAFTADGWFRTGDLVRRDEEGFVHIVDRIKDVVIRGGENVYCAEVEEVLAEHPDVQEAAVVGVPDPLLGEEVAAVVRVATGASVTAEDLRDHARRRLAAFKVPTRFVVGSDALPRNAAGKVLKRELRTRFEPLTVLSRSDHT
ncbi:class I adenylate-forming enzyme family protein [Pseudonocardia benzenivorans]